MVSKEALILGQAISNSTSTLSQNPTTQLIKTTAKVTKANTKTSLNVTTIRPKTS
jgi:hypothetical protein